VDLLFEWIKKVAAHNKVKGAAIIHRVKRFFDKYISLCAKIVYHPRQQTIAIFNAMGYEFQKT
jgi:hypothetical protein